MANGFDPNDRKNWYFGPISRQDATNILMSEKDGGVFLIRDSSSIPGDYVLCVKEDCKVCHYIINRIFEEKDGTKYRIGDRVFPNLPALLAFYKLHYLDTTPLVRPANRRLEKVIGKHDFDGSDPEDLSFKKGEILTVINKDEDQWWTAKNAMGRIGAIPVPYIRQVPFDDRIINDEKVSSSTIEKVGNLNTNFNVNDSIIENSGSGGNLNSISRKKTNIEPKKNTYARVKQARVPNAYDDTALKLQVGNMIRVTKINISGQWEGELFNEDGKVIKKGHFPFTHVELLDYDPMNITETEIQGQEI